MRGGNKSKIGSTEEQGKPKEVKVQFYRLFYFSVRHFIMPYFGWN